MAKIGRPPSIPAEQYPALRQLVQEHPHATLEELAQAWAERSGCDAPCTLTLAKTLRRAGLQRMRPKMAARAPVVRQRYGYTQQHRQSPANAALSDAQWALVRDLFELPQGSRGRPALHARRTMLDACLYILRTGSSWRSLPAGIYPPWQSVHKAFVLWTRQGRFERMQERISKQARAQEGKGTPTEAVIDSQATRGSPQGGQLGLDMGKKVKGRKRHLVVDGMGLLLAVVITSAAVPDRAAAMQAVQQACKRTQHSLTMVWADSAYAGQCAHEIEQHMGVQMRIVRSSMSKRWDDAQESLWPEPQPVKMPQKRWVVERTHAWLERFRRLVMHHDRKPIYAAAWVWLAQARALLDRLA